MLDQDLVDLLACPETQQSLTLADDAMMIKMNEAIASGTLLNRDKKKITQSLDTVLIREDQQYAYPVINGIPVLIVEEGISLSMMSVA